jgi:hypothetical protein
MLLRGRVARAVRRTALLVVLLTVHASPLAAESSPAAQPVQHAPWEMSFTTSREQNWREFVATAVFTQGDRRVEVDAFWDGGREWRVRFAPPSLGAWSWALRSEDEALKDQSARLQPSSRFLSSRRR